jgi:hypothetical protein
MTSVNCFHWLFTGGLVNGGGRSGEHVIEMPAEEKKAEVKSNIDISITMQISYTQL